MHYLYEHQPGYHSLASGFPGIDNCNAIYLQAIGYVDGREGSPRLKPCIVPCDFAVVL